MIRQLADPANAITATGLVLSIVGVAFALSGRLEAGVAIVLWALLADHLDGVVAKRTQNRDPRTGEVGKNLDSLVDLVSAGIFPGVTLMVAGDHSIPTVAIAIILAVASALRLSYFNVFGSPGGRFIGVPTTYVLPVTAIVFLLRPILPADAFVPVFAAALVVLAVCHVLPIRVPKTAGAMYAVITLFCIVSSALLIVRP